MQKQLEDLVKKLYACLPKTPQFCEQEIKNQFNILLQAAFAQMNLVTREEFDVQVKVLARTREKIEILEKLCNTLIH